MQILGPNLEQLFNFCDKRFSTATICNIFHQMLTRLQVVHEHDFVHRDLKPENICIGQGKKSNICYLIDFGLTKRFRCPKTGDHITFKQNLGIVGTAMFLSLNSHLGAEHGRRDDLEALCNIMIYLFNQGKLPWAVTKPYILLKEIDPKDPNAYNLELARTKAEKKYNNAIIKKKQDITVEELC